MQKKRFPAISLVLFSLASSLLSYGRIVNYTAPFSVYDFACEKEVVWAASSGGLFRYDRASGSGVLYSDPALFPDPSISALCLDANRTLWMGSAAGYLYKRPPKGRQAVIHSYASAGWRIHAIVSYGRYLFVGSDKGCSVFDTLKLSAVKNATAFGTAFTNPKVNAVAVFRDTLLLGLEEGVAKLYVGGNSLQDANFYDQSIWTADTAQRLQVKSFVVLEESYLALSTPGTVLQGKLITTSNPANDNDSTEIFADSSRVLTLPSRVLSITGCGGEVCCIGTKYGYFYLWDGNEAANVTIDGPAFTTARRVYVDRKGVTWVLCPHMKPGITMFRNGRWNLYNADNYEGMGEKILLAGEFKGVAEDHAGRMWFGTFGQNVKHYDPENDAWTEYCIGCIDIGQGQFYRINSDWRCQSWAKCDAIARDTTGFLWLATYNNYAGSLICYDSRFPAPVPPIDTSLPPSEKHYRYFFPPGDPVHSVNIGCLSVDAANNIVMCEGDFGNGKIHVLRHAGNPLEQGFESIWELPDAFGIAFDAAATRDTLTYVATSAGFYTLDPGARWFAGGLWIRDRTSPGVSRKTLVDSIRGVRTVEMEDDRVVWLGTEDSGLVRYDLSAQRRTAVTTTHGLLSNRINDLSFDRKNGYLWIASERGVSRYSLGYTIGRSDIVAPLVYPNPFSKRRHVEMIFEKLPPSSKVLIYSVSGTHVASLAPEESGASGSVCVWKPHAAVAPGIYLYTIRSGTKNSRGKIVVTP